VERIHTHILSTLPTYYNPTTNFSVLAFNTAGCTNSPDLVSFPDHLMLHVLRKMVWSQC